MKWELATVVVAFGGAIIGAVCGWYSTRPASMERGERSILAFMLGALIALAAFLLLSGVVGLLYFFGKPPSWWPVIAMTWLIVAACGCGYSFPDARINGRRRKTP